MLRIDPNASTQILVVREYASDFGRHSEIEYSKPYFSFQTLAKISDRAVTQAEPIPLRRCDLTAHLIWTATSCFIYRRVRAPTSNAGHVLKFDVVLRSPLEIESHGFIPGIVLETLPLSGAELGHEPFRHRLSADKFRDRAMIDSGEFDQFGWGNATLSFLDRHDGSACHAHLVG